MLPGQARLERHDRVGSLGASVEAGQVEHLRDMGYVPVTNRGGLFVVGKIVLPVGKPEAGLECIDAIVIRILHVRELEQRERHAVAALGCAGEVHG